NGPAMAYEACAGEIAGTVPKLSPFLARKLVARAWRDIRDTRTWSFLVADAALVAPNAVSAGTVAVVQGSATVQADATAQAALVVLATAANPPVELCQFRVNQGPIYNITAFDSGTGVITLDRIYLEASG